MEVERKKNSQIGSKGWFLFWKVPGGWHLDGQKHWIGNSTIAGARRFRARIRGRSKNPRREEPIIFRGGRG